MTRKKDLSWGENEWVPLRGGRCHHVTSILLKRVVGSDQFGKRGRGAVGK